MLTVVDAVGSGATTAAGVARGAGVVETGAGGRIEVNVDGGPKDRASSAAQGAAAEGSVAEATVRGVLASALASSVTAIVGEDEDAVAGAGAGAGTDADAGKAMEGVVETPAALMPTSITHHQPQIPSTQIREVRLTKLHHRRTAIDLHASLCRATHHAKLLTLLIQTCLVQSKPARDFLLMLRGEHT
jgi:hypothetical protein